MQNKETKVMVTEKIEELLSTLANEKTKVKENIT